MSTSDSDALGIRVFATLTDVPKEPVSQDPLGFAPSAERLADVFAPGLTVNTRSVRYYQLLTAGLQLSANSNVSDPRSVVLRSERLWAMASYLANPDRGRQPGSGLAGITRVRDAARPGNKRQRIDYRMFRGDGQARLGVWGLYRRSAERLLLVDGVEPTDLGIRLAHPFLANLESHQLWRAVVGAAGTASTGSLKGFGLCSGHFARVDRESASAAWEALRLDPNRRATAKALRAGKRSQDHLIERLIRMPQFKQSATAATALETMFLGVSRLFDAAVTLAEQGPVVDPTEVRDSPVLVGELGKWRKVAARRCDELELGGVDVTIAGLGRAIAQATDPWEAVMTLVDRHQEVQRTKGRQVWLDWHGGHLVRVAPNPNRGYDPFNAVQVPRGHDFRLLNLQALAIEVYQAGVPLK